MIYDAISYLQNEHTPHVNDSSQTALDVYTTRHIFFTWAPHFYHSLDDFLKFVKHNNLASKVESFMLVTESMLSGKLHRFPHLTTDRDWRYRCAAAFWQHLMSILDPGRVVILASSSRSCLPRQLRDRHVRRLELRRRFVESSALPYLHPGYLLTLSSLLLDMAFHVLDLRLDAASHPASPLLGKAVDYSTLDHTPRRYPGIAGSSILSLRPWHHITVNEGAFLKAYGTYEYFERGPPSLIYSIKDCLTPRPTYSASVQRLSQSPLASLRKLTYIAIFPFAHHMDFRELLPQLEELDLQLAPTSSVHGRSILNDPHRVGKAELQDCWSELVASYQNLVGQLATYRITERNMPRLERLLCRDMERATLHRELDEVFIGLCLPVWAEMETGVYVRLKMRAEVESEMGS